MTYEKTVEEYKVDAAKSEAEYWKCMAESAKLQFEYWDKKVNPIIEVIAGVGYYENR